MPDSTKPLPEPMLTSQKKFIPKDLIDNKLGLVQIMALHQAGDMQLFEAKVAKFIYTYMRHAVWMS